MQESIECSSNYPDKFIPMPMPVDINSGMPMGGLGRKKRDENDVNESGSGSESGSQSDTLNAARRGRNARQVGGGITMATSVDQCGRLCLSQLNEMKPVEKVSSGSISVDDHVCRS